MRIQHNISALNSWGKLGINQSNAAKNLEKLSSGYRINRAGDDAAGLAISEKMRGQIRGLDMASKNAQDGISLIQTAEGALDETHSILQRMRELAVQSANGTYQDEDRANTDLEIQALKDELDRIANSTHFNKIQLLDGSLSAGGTNGTAGKAAAKVTVSDAAMTNNAFKVQAAAAGEYRFSESLTGIQDGATNSYTFTYTDEKGNIQNATIKMSYNANDGKIVDEKGETLAQATGTTAGADATAQALKAALEKTDFGKNFKIDVVTKDGLTADEAKASQAYTDAQTALDAAQADYDADNNGLIAARDNAQTAYDGKVQAEATAKGTYDSAKTAWEAFDTDLYTQAKAAYNATTGTTTDKENAAKAIYADFTNADAAKTAFDNADNAYKTAVNDTKTAKTVLDAAQATLDNSAEKKALDAAQANRDALALSATNATIKLTAKQAGTSAPILKGFIQDTAGVDSNATATGNTGGTSFDLDFSKVDISRLKVGDTITIGGTAIAIKKVDTAAPGDLFKADGTEIYMDNIKSTEDLAAAIAGALNGNGTVPEFLVGTGDAGDGTVTAMTAGGAAANGSKVTISLDTNKLASTNDGLDVDLKNIINAVEYTDASTGKVTDNGLMGRAGSGVTNYTLETDKAAADRYESYDMTQVGVWDGSDPNSNIEDKVFTVDGQKFLFVKEDNMLSNTNMMKALEYFGNDVNVVITNGNGKENVAPTEQDVMEMANRIKEKTGTNVIANGKTLEFHSTKGTNGASGEGKLVFQIGANGDADQRVSMSIDDMSSKGIGVDKVDIRSTDSANAAIDIIDNAINTVSATRANLGAMQNRLEHTINSLNTTSENLTAAESRIRDVDMAKEMMAFTKNNILTQAAQAMLAQANQQPQGVLQLLQ